MNELNIVEFSESGYKYVITFYDDVTEIHYYEDNEEKEPILKESFILPCPFDVQICKKIVQMRKLSDDEIL